MDRSKPWRGYPVVVLDVETTGLYPEARDGAEADRVVELAAVRFEPTATGHTIAATVASVVNPGRSIPAEVSAIHGLTDEAVADAPPFPEVWRKVLDLFDADTVACAYSAAFDRGFLRAEHARLDAGYRDALTLSAGLRLPWLDPLVWVREIDRYEKGSGRHKLAATSERWGSPLEDAHAAASDAVAAGRLMLSERMRDEVAALVYGRSVQTVRASRGLAEPSLVDVVGLQVKLAERQEARHREYRAQTDASLGQGGQCRSCGAAIVWVEMDTGRRMPLDVAPWPSGNVLVSESRRTGKVITGAELDALRESGHALHVSHFATCPNAAQHRAPRRG